MKKLKEVYRLKFEFQYSNRVIAQSVNISPGTVSDYLNLFKVSGLSWPAIAHIDGEALEKLIYCHPTSTKPTERPRPDWGIIHMERKRKGVTLQLLWREYKNQEPNGLGYTQFCNLYHAYCKTLDPVMRFTHVAGEKTFVDYSGLKMEWIDLLSGEIHSVEIFVGCLGASNLIYAEATESQALPDWISSHVRMFEAFGGVSEMLVPDNLRSSTHKAHRYDPDLNATYRLLGEHYNIAIIPARIVRPRDKAKVENAVQCVERELIAPLRHRTFTSLIEINQALAEKLKQLNQRPMQRIHLSRQQKFEQFEKATLQPLPKHRFELQEWKKAKVHIDYHICVNKHFYSVPHPLIGKTVDVCLTKNRLEIFVQSERVAFHIREDNTYRFTTVEEHMPPKHRHYLQEEKDSSVTHLMNWAKSIGPSASVYVDKFFQVRAFPQQAIRAVLGLKRLAHRFGQSRFEEACKQGLLLNRYRTQVIENILKHDLDKIQNKATDVVTKNQRYCRGPEYYQQQTGEKQPC
ncbi:MAG: IS21 family transposase [Gammaproteobacteria bacterium]